MLTIGPFFYIDGKFLTHKISVEQGDVRGDRIDNPYSHEKLYDDNYSSGDYINVPRGRVIWDSENNRTIIYIDTCIEKVDGAVKEIAKAFGLTDYLVEHDEHYVCPNCMRNIWE
ncbi:MAG: hypothetical protein Q8882_01820 [Bacillota bacterium]|nr:hypothetical protein [Bacillota bacterium]